MAEAPITVECPEDQWTKVSTGVKIAKLFAHPAFTLASYVYTYRPTGAAAPDQADRDIEGVPVFTAKKPIKPVNSEDAIDSYIWCENRDGKVILWTIE